MVKWSNLQSIMGTSSLLSQHVTKCLKNQNETLECLLNLF